jgi:acetyltransferase
MLIIYLRQIVSLSGHTAMRDSRLASSIEKNAALFEPKSLAIVGASADPAKWGNTLCRRLLGSGYRGRLYPINPTASKILRHRAYPSVLKVPDRLDQVIITTRASTVPSIVDECIAKRVKVIVIITSGFSEVGDKGRSLEREMVSRVRAAGIRLVGPNCMGTFSLQARLNTTNIAEIPSGNIAVVAQSGNIANSLIKHVLHDPSRPIGFSHIVTLGNQADVEFHDCLRYLREDPKTKALILYIEQIKNGRAFVDEARKTTRIKPILALKAGSTLAGSRAALSHTGSIVGDDELYDAAFDRSGVIRVKESRDLLPIAEALVTCPAIAGKRIAILTDGGGHGTLAADAAESYGLELPVPSENVQHEFKSLIPMGSAMNPIDMDGADFNAVITPLAKGCLRMHFIDGLLIAGGFGGFKYWFGTDTSKIENEIARRIGTLLKEYGKPIIVHSHHQHAYDRIEAFRILRRMRVPVYDTPELAARCFWNLAEYRRLRTAKATPRIIPRDNPRISEIMSFHGEGGALLEPDVMRILEQYEIPTAKHALATSPQEAKVAGEKVGYPLAMKVVSPEIVHKSDAGCVKLNVGRSEAETMYEQIVTNAKAYNPRADVKGVMVYEMMPKGLEMAVGMVRKPPFGPFLMVGLGGLFVEALRDVQFIMIPTSLSEVRERLERLKAYPILKGFRGMKPISVDAVAALAERVSQLAAENTRISEIDLNPVLAYEDRAVAVDARMTLENTNIATINDESKLWLA